MSAPIRLAKSLSEHYRIDREVGAGGMATVYLAHDLKHDRDVAIKVLHPDLGAALGGDRFLTEIRTTARLQHPHILPLLDSGEADGLLYYVMPYVAGESLRDRLVREQQLPIEDAVLIASEIADALGAAHALGIVHRDIKPENILLQGGHALVADFGIALAVESAGSQRLTQTGLSLGTPNYMSPEQAMGDKHVDARSDVYSLGAMTYEMLVGEPPFTGATVQTIVAKVMTERPIAPTALRDTIPRHVERAVLKALSKLPADRYPNAERFRDALVRAEVSSADNDVAPLAAPHAKRWYVAQLAGALALAIAAYAIGRRSTAAKQEWSQFTQLTDATGVETAPTLSPDGEYFAYASNARGTLDIYVQRVGGHNPTLVAGDSTQDETWPAYSPDGKQIAYARGDGGIFVVGATGESARRLTTFGSNPAWSPDGKRIVFGSEEVKSVYQVNATGTLWTVDVATGVTTRLDPAGKPELYQPSWSPSGKRIAYWSSREGQRDIETIAVDGGPRVTVTNDAAVDWAPVWAPDGKSLVFASDRGGSMGIWRIGIEESSGRPSGEPELIASGVDAEMDLPRLSKDGNAILFRSKLESVNPAVITLDQPGTRIESTRLLQRRTGFLAPSDVSRDGKWLALFSPYSRDQHIYVMRTDGTALARLTEGSSRDWNPNFTPDGSAITYYGNASGSYQGWSIRMDGSGKTQLTNFGSVAYVAFAPDGSRLLIGEGASTSTPSWFGAPPFPVTSKTATSMKSEKLLGAYFTPVSWSPDGRFIAGYLLDSASNQRGLVAYDVKAQHVWRLSEHEGVPQPVWLSPTRVAYFSHDRKLTIEDVSTGQRVQPSGTLPFEPSLGGDIASMRDGRTLYYGAREVQANIWLVKLKGSH